MAKKILTEDSRERLVAAYENTKDVAAIALMFGVSESSVYRLVNQKRKTGSLALNITPTTINPKTISIVLALLITHKGKYWIFNRRSNKMKSYLRKWKIRIKEKLPEAMRKALSFVTTSDCHGWFSHCGLNLTIS